jgi:NADH:ubiquinone oxidoreductase subunit 5 (subunit L)/multisubunit Na+/H+ antiporter MnhA subunit
MNWEAVLVIGLFVGTPCAVLLAIGLFFAKRWSKTHPNNPQAKALAPLDILLLGAMVAGLLVGVSAQQWAAGSEFAELLQAPGGMLLYSILLILGYAIVGTVVKLVLRRHGSDTRKRTV